MSVMQKNLEWMVRGLTFIALHGCFNPLSGKVICRALGLKSRSLEPLLRLCVKAKILKSIRGGNGGYTLIQDRRKIKLSDLYRLLLDQEYKRSSKKAKGLNQEYDFAADAIKSLSKTVQLSILQTLELVTLEDICNQTEPLSEEKWQAVSHFVI